MSAAGKCPCEDCAAVRKTRISRAGVVTRGQEITAHDRLIVRLQYRNSRGKAARRRGGRRRG